MGEEMSAEELEGIDRYLAGLEGELGEQLVELLTPQETDALAARCTRLRSAGRSRGRAAGCMRPPGLCSKGQTARRSTT